MNFDFNDEQRAIKEAARDMLAARYPLAEVRRLATARDLCSTLGDAWMAIAPPVVVVHDIDGLTGDPRPKLLVLAQHDEYRDPAEVTELAEPWANTDVHVVGGASHFFVGRTDRLVELAAGYVDELAPAPSV